MTGFEYVKHRLEMDFGANRSQTIIYHLISVMKELTTPDDLEQDLTSDFQLLLNDSVYPFLACYQAMQDAGVDIHIANRYVKKICEELPEEMKVAFAMRDAGLDLR